MADNFAFSEGSGKTGAADDIGGVLYPRVKIAHGADGSAIDVSTAPGGAFPVQLRNSTGTELTPLSEADFDTKAGALTETAPATDTASSGLNGRLQRIAQRLTSLIALLPAALTASGNLKIAVVESTATQAVSAASLPLPTGASTEATLATRLSESDFDSKTGALTEAAPASDTASSGLNGRLQRIAQRITSLIALLPTSLGQKAMAASLAVVIASDQSAVPASQSGTWTVQPGNTPNTTPWLVSEQAKTAGGATPYKLVSAATTNATSVKGSAGQVYMITASNVNAAARYLKLYNKATAPTVGTDTPVHTFVIPGNTAGAGTNIPVPSCGIEFTTGIAFALTTEATDAGTTAVAANEIVVNLAYK